MKLSYFTVFSVAVLLLVVNYGHSQEVKFSNKKQSATQTTSKKSLKNNNDKNIKSKHFKDENGLRAASTCHNCECQCDSYGWKDAKGNYIGNCETADTTGAKFCYISGRALRVCRDIQQSKYRQDSNNGQKKWYSYEACTTPTRNECYRLNQQYNQNCGDGDYNNGGGNNNGYPNNNNGYPNNNNGYPNNNNGHPNNNNGYPNNNNGYPNNNNGYPNNNNGYPNNNNGYPNNNNGYPNNNNGYPNNNNGYPNNNNGYPNNNNGYPNNNNGYPNSNNDRPNNNNGYPSNNNNGYPNNNNGYPSNNGNSWTLQSQIPGLGSPRIEEDKETSITFGEK